MTVALEENFWWQSLLPHAPDVSYLPKSRYAVMKSVIFGQPELNGPTSNNDICLICNLIKNEVNPGETVEGFLTFYVKTPLYCNAFTISLLGRSFFLHPKLSPAQQSTSICNATYQFIIKSQNFYIPMGMTTFMFSLPVPKNLLASCYHEAYSVVYALMVKLHLPGLSIANAPSAFAGYIKVNNPSFIGTGLSKAPVSCSNTMIVKDNEGQLKGLIRVTMTVQNNVIPVKSRIQIKLLINCKSFKSNFKVLEIFPAFMEKSMLEQGPCKRNSAIIYLCDQSKRFSVRKQRDIKHTFVMDIPDIAITSDSVETHNENNLDVSYVLTVLVKHEFSERYVSVTLLPVTIVHDKLSEFQKETVTEINEPVPPKIQKLKREQYGFNLKAAWTNIKSALQVATDFQDIDLLTEFLYRMMNIYSLIILFGARKSKADKIFLIAEVNNLYSAVREYNSKYKELFHPYLNDFFLALTVQNSQANLLKLLNEIIWMVTVIIQYMSSKSYYPVLEEHHLNQKTSFIEDFISNCKDKIWFGHNLEHTDVTTNLVWVKTLIHESILKSLNMERLFKHPSNDSDIAINGKMLVFVKAFKKAKDGVKKSDDQKLKFKISDCKENTDPLSQSQMPMEPDGVISQLIESDVETLQLVEPDGAALQMIEFDGVTHEWEKSTKPTIDDIKKINESNMSVSIIQRDGNISCKKQICSDVALKEANATTVMSSTPKSLKRLKVAERLKQAKKSAEKSSNTCTSDLSFISKKTAFNELSAFKQFENGNNNFEVINHEKSQNDLKTKMKIKYLFEGKTLKEKSLKIAQNITVNEKAGIIKQNNYFKDLEKKLHVKTMFQGRTIDVKLTNLESRIAVNSEQTFKTTTELSNEIIAGNILPEEMKTKVEQKLLFEGWTFDGKVKPHKLDADNFDHRSLDKKIVLNAITANRQLNKKTLTKDEKLEIDSNINAFVQSNLPLPNSFKLIKERKDPLIIKIPVHLNKLLDSQASFQIHQCATQQSCQCTTQQTSYQCTTIKHTSDLIQDIFPAAPEKINKTARIFYGTPHQSLQSAWNHLTETKHIDFLQRSSSNVYQSEPTKKHEIDFKVTIPNENYKQHISKTASRNISPQKSRNRQKDNLNKPVMKPIQRPNQHKLKSDPLSKPKKDRCIPFDKLPYLPLDYLFKNPELLDETNRTNETSRSSMNSHMDSATNTESSNKSSMDISSIKGTFNKSSPDAVSMNKYSIMPSIETTSINGSSNQSSMDLNKDPWSNVTKVSHIEHIKDPWESISLNHDTDVSSKYINRYDNNILSQSRYICSYQQSPICNSKTPTFKEHFEKKIIRNLLSSNNNQLAINSMVFKKYPCQSEKMQYQLPMYEAFPPSMQSVYQQHPIWPIVSSYIQPCVWAPTVNPGSYLLKCRRNLSNII